MYTYNITKPINCSQLIVLKMMRLDLFGDNRREEGGQEGEDNVEELRRRYRLGGGLFSLRRLLGLIFAIVVVGFALWSWLLLLLRRRLLLLVSEQENKIMNDCE